MQDRIYISPPDRHHTVYRYTDQIYKIVQFKEDRLPIVCRAESKHYDEKLDCSLSRTRRVVLEKALCNPWEYFCTFTISPEKHDRNDLQNWQKKFTQFMRDQRKKGLPIAYLLVPERHKDGSWHAHGLISGIPESQLVLFSHMDKAGYRTPSGRRLPKDLIHSNYYNWWPYFDKFGFCSFGRIDNPIAAGFYVTKYVTKDSDRLVRDVGLHSYYSSNGLEKAEKHTEFYGRSHYIDQLLVNDYQYCKTGMTHVNNLADWTFCFEFTDFQHYAPLNVCDPDSPLVASAQKMLEFDQMKFFC